MRQLQGGLATKACVAFMRRGENTLHCERRLPLRHWSLAAALGLGLPAMSLVRRFGP